MLNDYDDIKCGVPQLTLLGQTIFLENVNDLWREFRNIEGKLQGK